MTRLKIPVKQLFRNKKVIVPVFSIVLAFLLANLFVGIAYRSKTYPNAHVTHTAVGSVSFADLEQHINNTVLLPEKVTLTVADRDEVVETRKLGISVNAAQTADNAKKKHGWLPVWDLFAYTSADYALQTDKLVLDTFVQTFVKSYEKAARNATFVLRDGTIQIVTDKEGSQLQADAVKQAIINAVASGTYHITLTPEITKANTTAKDLQSRLDDINKQVATSVTLTFKGKTKTFSPSNIAGWYELEGTKAELADGNIQASVNAAGQSFGILVANTAQAVTAIKDAVNSTKTLSFALKEAPKPTRHFTYCVAARGVPTNHLGVFSAKLASVYADKRGWGLNGQVTLSKVSSGCSFTAWLSAASQMPTFGAICDSTWSCRVGPNVVINFDRWQNASPAWNQSGGSLDNYRSMVINHETGHWFGYYHAYCGGAGQLAPVMQQQSINLQGCKFNPWPTAAELASHRRTLGL